MCEPTDCWSGAFGTSVVLAFKPILSSQAGAHLAHARMRDSRQRLHGRR
jgi:hypothetical protein